MFQLEKNNSILETYDRDLREFHNKNPGDEGGGSKGGGGSEAKGSGDDGRVQELEKELEEANQEKEKLQEENDSLKEQLNKMGSQVSCWIGSLQPWIHDVIFSDMHVNPMQFQPVDSPNNIRENNMKTKLVSNVIKMK